MRDRAAKAGKRPPEKIAKVGDGLYLLIDPSGERWWRFRYVFKGREKSISLGRYPDVSLAVARTNRDEARRLIAAGVDPSQERKQERRANADTFRAIAEEWLTTSPGRKREQKTIVKNRLRLVTHVYPKIGSLPVRDIDPVTLLGMCAASRRKGSTKRRTGCCSCAVRFFVTPFRLEG